VARRVADDAVAGVARTPCGVLDTEPELAEDGDDLREGEVPLRDDGKPERISVAVVISEVRRARRARTRSYPWSPVPAGAAEMRPVEAEPDGEAIVDRGHRSVVDDRDGRANAGPDPRLSPVRPGPLREEVRFELERIFRVMAR